MLNWNLGITIFLTVETSDDVEIWCLMELDGNMNGFSNMAEGLQFSSMNFSVIKSFKEEKYNVSSTYAKITMAEAIWILPLDVQIFLELHAKETQRNWKDCQSKKLFDFSFLAYIKINKYEKVSIDNFQQFYHRIKQEQLTTSRWMTKPAIHYISIMCELF